MTQHNLTQILKVIRDFVMRNRPCYRDYLGSETTTKTMQIGAGTFEDKSGKAIALFNTIDPAFTGFVLGETYTVTIDGVTADYVARNLAQVSERVGPIIGTITTYDMENDTFDGWATMALHTPEGTDYVSQTYDMSFVGKTISISKTKTETVKRYKTKLLPEYLLPAFLRKNVVASKTEVQKAQATADNAQTVANHADNVAQVALNAADNAQTKASTALTRANNAQATANNAQAAANAAQSVANTALERVVEPDWNQNDETAADYVKNRPFYTGDPVETVLVEESTVTFADQGGMYAAQFPSTFVATVGDTYKVYWDGTVYECTCTNLGKNIVIGNLSVAGAGSDTGEPFFMNVDNGLGILVFTADTSASHTFSISGVVAPIVKIPAKFIDKDASGYIVIYRKGTMTQQEAENYKDEISRNEVVFIIWNKMCISGISFGGTTGYDLQLTTQDGGCYFIKKNADGLFAYSDRKFSTASFPNGAITGTAPYPMIHFNNEKIQISPGVGSSGVGSTGTLFQVQPDGTKSKAFEVLKNGEAVAPALILYSSTADSTKKFRITVDDTGTLKATEVT